MWFGILIYNDGIIFGSTGQVGGASSRLLVEFKVYIGLRLIGNMVITLAITTIFLKLCLEVQYDIFVVTACCCRCLPSPFPIFQLTLPETGTGYFSLGST